MTGPIVECVPNFSEGRDPAVVDAIVNAIAAVAGVSVLAHESDRDHNRAVVTFAGPPQAAAQGAYQGIAEAVKRIDLSAHTGVHPRIGAADVVPFVPISGVTLTDCAALARATGEEVWKSLRVPVYLYEAAAINPQHVRLENLRRGGLPYLRDHISERRPDIGEPVLHPTAGAVIIGARKLLIAFNIYLNSSNVAIAKEVARAVRESSGGLKGIKALGLPISSRGLAQVSLNITDFELTSLFEIFEAVRRECHRLGTEIASSELIGLIPRRALEAAAAQFLKLENFSSDRVLEQRLSDAVLL